MDSESYEFIRARDFGHVIPIALSEVVEEDTDLAAARENRSLIEFYFTAKAPFCLYVLRKNPATRFITYLDADLFFFSSPESYIRQVSESSIALAPHNFPPGLRDRERFGRFNAGWVGFRNDETGRACLEWWRAQCLACCHDKPDDIRYADQKYLDYVPEQFGNVKVLGGCAVDIAPWNIEGREMKKNGETIMIDGNPLIAFHFHGVRYISKGLYDTGISGYGFRMSTSLRETIYRPYLECIASMRELVPEEFQNELPAARRESGRYTAGGGMLSEIIKRIRLLQTAVKIFYYNSRVRV